MVTMAVGCPVRDRTWVLDTWLQHVEDACGQAGVTPSYVFAVDPHDDSYTKVIERWADHMPVEVVFVEDPPLVDGKTRGWDQPERVAHMVAVRNQLLEAVRAGAPDFFWSIDSDILVAPRSLVSAVELWAAEGYDAVATLTWMVSVGTEWPNFGYWDPSNGGLRRMRGERGVRFAAPIIMACKLMTPPAYGVDYSVDEWVTSEDVGWSLECGRRGLRLAIDGAHPAKHVMSPAMLYHVDERVGW